ncbi:MAG: squalene/phytoene synthase family protein [Candidatus Latescibacteria bacterium]|nr:squalene/phytoene synthase family protein [Candidatus Latescibacterota bacterium]
MRPPFSLSGAEAIAETIAARDYNNLYRTSCFFRDVERYRAFCAQYAIMRVVDDRIDALPSRSTLSSDARRAEQKIVMAWRHAVTAAHRGQTADFSPLMSHLVHPQAGDLLEALTGACERFPVPLSLWDNFFDAMEWDLERSRFRTYQEFLGYAEGATVAPTTIYLYLLSASEQADGRYRPPDDFDLIRCGRALGIFSYLGHILRDLPDDLSTGGDGLLYFAADDLSRHHLTEEMLFADLAAGRGSEALRGLVADLAGRGRADLAEGRGYLTALDGRLTPDCTFILELIITIYEAVLTKIEACGYDPMARRHHLTDEEKDRIAFEVARRTAFLPTPGPRRAGGQSRPPPFPPPGSGQ